MTRASLVGWLLIALVSVPSTALGQYFGRNKVQYRTFDFQILRTEHFDLYYYPEEAEAAAIAARMAERWHDRLSRFFSHELRGRQPVILYAVSAHFRQTNAVEGLIGEGTGGVTEALKRRIVLPMSGSLADSDHVLGHELVHAFQFDMTGTDPRDNSGQAPGILAFPLWFVEGMAEYLTLGPVDGQTAMWLRDAAIREKLPHVRELDDPRYFPYRWGHAFWAFVGAKYGDRAVASLIRSAANPRYDLIGLARQLGTDPDTMTADWHAAISASTRAVADEAAPVASNVRRVIGPQTGGGRFNVGPEVSPDGRQIAFFSERDLFSVELFLADAETGRVQRKLLKSSTDPHFDSLEFVHSAGTWSPDGRALAITALRTGRPVIALIDPRSGDVRRELKLPGLDDASNPVFAPDGKSLVLSGNVGGLIDLYRYSLETAQIERLTNDPFADLEPAFTPDGRTVVFSTERFTTDLATLVPGALRLAALDLATRTVRPLSAFLRGKHLSPQVSADGSYVMFVGDPDGVSNLYRVPISGGPVEQLSSVLTGIAGVTSTSPTLSAASGTGRLAFSVFEDDGHSIYVLDPSNVVALVPPAANLQAAILPGRSVPAGDVYRLLNDPARGLPSADTPAPSEPYRKGLTLDEIGQPWVAGGVNEFGADVSGGISAFFSDTLGDRALGMSAMINGTVADLGAEVVYLNRRHRWNWVASAGVSPYAVGFLTLTRNAATGDTTLSQITDRQTSRGVFGAAMLPLNSAARLEFSGGAQALTFSREVRVNVYSGENGQLIDRSVERSKIADPLYLGQASVALVRDSSYFGATGPLFGARSRFEVGQSVGSLTFKTLLVDWRRYFMPARPFTVAVRAMHYGRYGRSSDNERIIPLYVGYPEFVHGYGIGSFSGIECQSESVESSCVIFDRLIGSRMAVANFEVRAPLKGLMTGELEYGRVPVDVVAFADAGVAWSGAVTPSFLGGTRQGIRSVGGAVRVNVFNLLALELSAAKPFDRIDRSLQWQLGLRQGF